MSWEKSNYTATGAALLSESLSGGALTITRAVSGTGSADTDLSEETTVSGDLHELMLLGIETIEDDDGHPARKVSVQYRERRRRLPYAPGGRFRPLERRGGGPAVPHAGRARRRESLRVARTLILRSTLTSCWLCRTKRISALQWPRRCRHLMKLVEAEIEKHNADVDAHAATITAAVSAAVKNLSESGEILNEEQVKALIKEQVDGGTGGYYGSYELTLAADGWKPARSEDDYENAGGMDYYQCIYDAELSDSTSELVPVGVVSPGSFYTTTKAGVLNGCETHDGFIRFFAQRIPEADIQATVTLFGKGGGSGETGSVSIGQGLKRDASGAIAVRIGEGLDFDSANALTVRKETVMTSEDLLNEEETQQEIVDMLK